MIEDEEDTDPELLVLAQNEVNMRAVEQLRKTMLQWGPNRVAQAEKTLAITESQRLHLTRETRPITLESMEDLYIRKYGDHPPKVIKEIPKIDLWIWAFMLPLGVAVIWTGLMRMVSVNWFNELMERIR